MRETKRERESESKERERGREGHTDSKIRIAEGLFRTYDGEKRL